MPIHTNSIFYIQNIVKKNFPQLGSHKRLPKCHQKIKEHKGTNDNSAESKQNTNMKLYYFLAL